MEQVLLNLILNARDAMPRGGKVSVQTSNLELPGSQAFVRLAVEDNGAGMDSEVAEHLFEPFFTSKKREVGKGLGLAVVHAVVTAADGLINVDSSPGAGSLFEIFLPLWKNENVIPALMLGATNHSAGGSQVASTISAGTS
jgi:signal transduction histidine kinase